MPAGECQKVMEMEVDKQDKEEKKTSIVSQFVYGRPVVLKKTRWLR